MKQQFIKPTFNALNPVYPGSIANLGPALTINGTTVYPTLRYKGQDATATNWPAWGFGETLSIAGSGASPTLNAGSPLMGSMDDSVRMNMVGSAGKSYASSTAFAGINLEDFVVEMLCVTAYPGMSGDYSGAGKGWMIYELTTGRISCYVAGVGGAVHTLMPSGYPYQLVHLLWFYDASNKSVFYYNGIQTSENAVNTVGSISVGQLFILGYGGNTNIYYIAMWRRDNWLDTHIQPTIAKDRFSKLNGTYANISSGATKYSTFTRATTAFLDKTTPSSVSLYQVGLGWPRICSRPNVSGTLITGYLAEPASTNFCLRSEEFFNSSWAKSSVTDTWSATLSPVVTSSGTCRQDAFSTTSANLSQVVSPGGGSVVNRTFTGSIYARLISGGPDIYLGLYSDVGWLTGRAKEEKKTLTVQWSRISITHTFSVTGSSTMAFYVLTNGLMGNPALPAITVELWGAQLEEKPFATSYIPTTTATVTRNADILTYKADDGNMSMYGGTVTYSTLLPSLSYLPANYNLLTIDVNGSATGAISHILNSSGQKMELKVVASGTTYVDITDTTTYLTDNNIHRIKSIYSVDNVKLLVDGIVEGTPDTSCPWIQGISRIDVGMDGAQASQPNALISDLRIYNL
jgi:hypothetical protein